MMKDCSRLCAVLKSVNQICDLYLQHLRDEVARGDRSDRNLRDYKTVVDKFIIWRQNY